MDPTLFNYPLTLKIRISETWNSCRAMQDNEFIPVTVVNHEGVQYALVNARPNKGPIILAQ
ncbi:hypothetical protein [Puniceicoccus vermicola]|uniref:Uncharacterized protein n=1 Tax=Puniceicoccus vermicola TaxID=388746 RepID=A0A7X1AZ12_9BACT|nr:hypothetical protein [Puniceicoccus vermicola]MBC2602588.1 hypothetical protein [Puniceicoccus vermicola]